MTQLPCRTLLLAIVLACLPAARASAQTEPPRGMWIAVGGASTTLQGACGEGCDFESPYFHKGTVLADIGHSVNPRTDAGVEIALAPDWAVTGSSNMLDELKVAARWNREQLGGRLTDRQLVDMATSAAARAVGVDDQVGAIVPGLRADLLVVSGDPNDALGAVIGAGAGDVQLVMIGGVPLYGARGLMAPFWANADLEKVFLPGGPKVLASPAAGVALSDVAARLTAALLAEGTSLAPLTDATAR